MDWAGLLRRTFALDVFASPRCACRRTVLAYVTAPSGVRSTWEHLGLPSQALKRAPARGPSQQGGPSW
ncbi:ATP-dependent helicase HrpA [Vitiosangium sp. GDMCC 1.1324]|nr:ATP-dependent helicase HrpA [Vitiosangium sp. GDMCC 1.1324]